MAIQELSACWQPGSSERLRLGSSERLGLSARHEISLDRPFCFLHIPKTAGITVRQLLQMRLPPGEAYDVPGDPAREENLGPLGIVNDDLYELHLRKPHLAYLSHVPYNWLRNFPRRPHLFTVLRDPVDRVLSHYYFLRELILRLVPDLGPLHEQFCKLEIDEYLREQPDRFRVCFGELQTRWLTAGPCWDVHDYDPSNPPPPLVPADLTRAKKRLRQCAVVGLTHRLLESLQLLCEVFDWAVPEEVGHENTTCKRPTKDQIDPRTLRLLEEHTAFDRALFAEGTRLFERQLARRGKRRRRAPAPTGFTCTFDQGVPGYGWLAPEWAGDRWYCWSGKTAWLDFPMRPASRLAVEIEMHHTLDPALYKLLEVRLNEQRLHTKITAAPGSGRAVHLTGFIDSPNLALAPERNRLSFRLPRTLRPCEVMPGHPDTRSLGVAVSRVEVRAALTCTNPLFRMFSLLAQPFTSTALPRRNRVAA